MLGSLILYFKGRRLMMFQLSGFYCNIPIFEGTRRVLEGFGLFASRIRRLLGLLWQPKIPFSAFWV